VYFSINVLNSGFNKLQDIVNTDLKRIFDWFNFNKLVANLSKSNYLLIGCDSNKKLELHIDIRETNSLKILGVTFDKRLSFDYDTEKLSKTVSKKVGAIYRIRKFLPQNTLILSYKTLIQSNLIYSCQVWGHTYETHLKKIQIIQNMALRIIASTNYGTDVTNLYNQLKIMKIFDIISYYSNVYIYKSLHKLNSFLSENFFELVNRSQRS
jgi:hypothetical protein